MSLVLDPGGEEPPQFAPYDASFFVSGSAGHIISHDPHLNEDGEALYRFLLSQATTPPQLSLHCRGSHDETRSRLVRSEHSDRSQWRTEHYTENVVDFDFYIDVGQHIISSDPTHWSIADSAPEYRGRMFREVGIAPEKRKATGEELKAAKAWDYQRHSKGFPPWVSSNYIWREDQPHVMREDSVFKSSWTLRQWADDYCSSRKFLKQFEYHKVVYGWDFGALEAATRSAIVSTHYEGDLQVSFETLRSKISVRSDNRLSRALSNGWIKFLLIITFLYPFVWLFRRFHYRGGGIWSVCGGAYALKRIEWVASSKNPYMDVQLAGDTSRQASGAAGFSDANTRTIGLREGTWFRQWEGTIRGAVLNRLQDHNPLLTPNDEPTAAANMLDGY